MAMTTESKRMRSSSSLTELQQGSDDWFNARIGRVTASNVGAILGLSPFRKRADVMRSMVREYCGALSEFTGNVATEYGNMNERLARFDYELKTGATVETTGFHTHAYNDWLGASPDGFIGSNALVEFKCPFGLRNGGEFKSIDVQRHYYAQMQIQMYVTNRTECDFVQWHKDGLKIELVKRDTEYLNEILPVLGSFYNDYLIEREEPHNAKHLKSRHGAIDDDSILLLAQEYTSVKDEIKALNAMAESLLKQIVDDCSESESSIGIYRLTKVSRKTMGYANIVKELLSDADLKKYETTSTFWKLS
jgi:putative phage-type endonuclease